MAVIKQTKREIETREKKQKIIDIAIRLFNEYGYEQTTIADISQATGMSTGSIYNFFGSKAGIVIVIIKDIYWNAAEFLHVDLNDVTCIGEHIMNYYLYMAEEFAKYEKETLKAYTNAASLDYYQGKQEEYIKLVHGQIEVFLQQAKEKGLWVPEDSIKETVEIFHMEFMGIIMTWIYYSIHDNLKESVERNMTKILKKMNLL